MIRRILTPFFASALALTSACGAAQPDEAKPTADFPPRAAGLWELTKSVTDDPRPLPVTLQCTDEVTDRRLGANAFLVNYLGCSKLSMTPDGAGWRIESTCASEAGVMEEKTRLTGDLKTSYRMEQEAVFPEYSMTVRQVVTAKRIGACGKDVRPGEIRIGDEVYDLIAIASGRKAETE